MKRIKLLAVGYLLILAFSANAQGLKNYSTLHLVVDDGEDGQIYHFKLYINDSLIGKINSFEHCKIGLQSTGSIKVTLLCSEYKATGSVYVTANKEYFLYNSPGSSGSQIIHVGQSDEWSAISKKSTKTIKIEEDINKPWGKISDPPASNDFSVLHLMGTGGGSPFSVYINDYLVTNINPLEELNIKLYSQGRLSVTVLFAHDKQNSSIEVKGNKDYYMIEQFGYNQGLKEIDEKKWQPYHNRAKNNVDVEEDVKKPWGKIAESKTLWETQSTCFVISPMGYLITNYHCVEKAKELTVQGIDGDFTTKYSATVVATDPSNDLALIKVSNKNIKFETPPFAIRSSGVAQGEKVYALGFPIADAMGKEIKLTEGIISAKSGAQGDISKFQISAAVNHGNSGGPLIDEQGNLIGVIYAKSTVAEAAGYAIKASYLEAFLKNIDGFEFPNLANTMKEKLLIEKISVLKGYIFILETK
jgi:S1-C subfamily serine protease